MNCSLLDIQTDPQAQRCLEVHERITDIVQDLVSQRTFPVYEVIMQILLDRYGVNHWLELSIGPIENVPIAKHLFILNKKISLFLTSYFATNSIITLTDMSFELTNFLKALHLPTLSQFVQQQVQRPESKMIDPNEISLGEEDSHISHSSHSPLTFEDYGLGGLSSHPIVHFHYIAAGLKDVSVLSSSTIIPSKAMIHSKLKLFLTSPPSLSSYHNHPVSGNTSLATSSFISLHTHHFSLNLDHFLHFLRVELGGVADLTEVGVIIQPDKFHDDYADVIYMMKQQLRQSLSSRVRDFIPTSEEKTSLSSDVTTSEAKKTRQEVTSETTEVRVRLKQVDGSENAVIHGVVDACHRYHNSSPYSLTQQKIDSFATHYLLHRDSTVSAATTSNDRTAEKTRRKRKARDAVEVEPEVMAEESSSIGSDGVVLTRERFECVSAVLKEYLFLVFGKSSKLMKKYDVTTTNTPLNHSEHVISTVTSEKKEEDMSATLPPPPPSQKIGLPQIITSDVRREFHLSFTPTDISKYEHSSELMETIDTALIHTLFSEERFLSLQTACLTSVHERRRSKGGGGSGGGSADRMMSEDVGYWGECFVYHYLQHLLPTNTTTSGSDDRCYDYTVQWKNEVEESRASYDVVVVERWRKGGREREKHYFIEVKSTQWHNKNAFSLSWQEFQFFTASTMSSSTSSVSLPCCYLFRVENAMDWRKVRIVILKDIGKLLEFGTVQLCLAI